MPYVAVRFAADAGDAERWMDALLDTGALSVDVSDPHAGTEFERAQYDEPGEEAALWPINRVTALFASDVDIDAALAGAAQALDCAMPAHECHPIADDDWVRATQRQFSPLHITDRLWIVPSWCEPVDRRAVNLVLDPGLAFGTGSHPTTRLCLEWLASALPRDARVLDYGCGSGILAIAAAKLGAAEVVGADIDPQAIAASRVNAARNDAHATFLAVDEFQCTSATFDVVLANILANPLRLLAPVLAMRVRRGGSIVLSGILVSQAEDVAAAYAQWFSIFRWRECEGWVVVTGARDRV